MEGTETVSTPVSTTETTTAAPATTETTSASSTSQRPTNVRELAAFMEKSATTTTDPAASLETAATGQAAPTDLTGATAMTKGVPPEKAWPGILENARAKSATEAVAKYREQYGWAEQVPQAQLQEFSALASRMSTDPVGFATAFMQELQQHPTYGPQLRSHAGRMLATRTAATDAEPKPDRQIVDDAGRVIGQTYADGGAAHAAWLKRQIQAEFAPLKAERDQRIATEQAAHVRQQVEAKADGVMAELDDILDGAVTQKNGALLKEVEQVMAAHPEWSAHKAALQVRKDRIVPTLQQKAQQQVVATFNNKAAGNTANGSGSATPTRPRNATELAAWMAANFR